MSLKAREKKLKQIKDANNQFKDLKMLFSAAIFLTLSFFI